METIKIEIPKGYEASFNKLSSEIKFKEKPKEVTERIRTIADILDDHGLTPNEFERQCNGLSDDEVAYRILKLLTLSLNEGWQPNWNDSSEYKYIPWFDMRGGSSGFRFLGCGLWVTRSASAVGSRLCFKTRGLAGYAGQQFTDVYKQLMLIK